MQVIAITGGIGAGKSLVLKLFEKAGCHTISMDDLSRELTRPGEAGFTKIVDTFGREILAPDNTINRPVLVQLVFNNPDKKYKLEQILHPLIEQAVRDKLDRLAKHDNPDNIIAVVEIPLLVKRNQFDFIDRVLVVASTPELQLKRVQARDPERSTDDIMKIINSQISDEERAALADDILYNTGDLDSLETEVMTLHEQYQSR